MYHSILKKIFLKKAYRYIPIKSELDYWESMSVPRKGGSLDCRIWKQKNISLGLVILVHPYNTQGKDFFLTSGHADLYFREGYDVVIFDLNGFGTSMDIGFDFEDDLLCIEQYFRKLLNPDLIIAHGISFGAAVLLKTLTRDHQFDKAIIENCLDEVRNYYKARNTALYNTIRLSQKISKSLLRKNQYYKFAASVKDIKKLLLIYAERDSLTTPEMGLKIRDYASVPCQYELLKGEHMKSIEADNERYMAVIKDYLHS